MASAISGGHIEEAVLQAAIDTIREIVDAYNDIELKVNATTERARLNWVGKGRNAFESQSKTLIRKIEDFDVTLREIYEGLVQALATYQEADMTIMQGYVKATEGMKG